MNKTIIRITIILFVVIGITFIGFKALNLFANIIMENNLREMRKTLYGDVPKEKRMLVGFGESIKHEIRFGPKHNDNDVQDYLDAGFDPNYCLILAEGWQYRNPLMLFNTSSMYVTWSEKELSYPDITVFNQLILAGANINKYPYVWAAVFCHGNFGINRQKKEFQKGYITEEEMRHRISCNIKDANRVLKLFLDIGCDVNRKGSPIPFKKGVCEKIKEDEIQNYFNSPEATTPLYEAIKKGMVWESQVDLLLEYGATLDESCREAAKLSGDEAMIQKIENLLHQQKN